ncbi:MAG: lysophospholipid acyltransferase family protein [Humibacillus sp.]
MPGTGPIVLVANHAAFLDGPLVLAMSPRPAHFLVKADAFRGLVGAVLRGVGQIPDDRSVGDRAALGTAVAVLEPGGVVGVFPSTSSSESRSPSPSTPRRRGATGSETPPSSCGRRSRHTCTSRGWRMVPHRRFTDSRTP